MILSELDLEFSDLAEIWYLLSSINSSTDAKHALQRDHQDAIYRPSGSS